MSRMSLALVAVFVLSACKPPQPSGDESTGTESSAGDEDQDAGDGDGDGGDQDTGDGDGDTGDGDGDTGDGDGDTGDGDGDSGDGDGDTGDGDGDGDTGDGDGDTGDGDGDGDGDEDTGDGDGDGDTGDGDGDPNACPDNDDWEPNELAEDASMVPWSNVTNYGAWVTIDAFLCSSEDDWYHVDVNSLEFDYYALHLDAIVEGSSWCGQGCGDPW